MISIKISSAGILYVYLAGKINDGKVFVHTINSYESSFDFYEGIKLFHDDLSQNYDIEILCILGIKEKVLKIGNIIENEIRENCNKFINEGSIIYENEYLDRLGNDFNRLIQNIIFGSINKYPIRKMIDKKAYVIDYFTFLNGKNDNKDVLIKETINTFLNLEFPLIIGKQIMIKSFEFLDLIGRKIVGIFPEENEWNLILEGGFKLELNSVFPYVRQTVGIDHVERITTRQADEIIMNPAYSYGENYYPVEIYNEWHKVFLYAMAITNDNLELNDIIEKYNNFLDFLKDNICKTMNVPVMMTKEEYYEVLYTAIERLNGFLIGKEDAVISKDLLLLLNTRYVYLPYIYEIVGFPILNEFKFDIMEFNEKIELLDANNSYQKGINLEDLASYFINSINGLEISGKRVKTSFGEIDLSVINISLDEKLWEMGAYILVECKNWKEKVDIKVIRNLSHISSLKGNKTTILFSINGLTKDAEDELIRTALNGNFIISIIKKDLINVKTKEDCYNLLIFKWNCLKQIVNTHLNI